MAAYVFLTISRNSEWKNNLTLYESDSKKSPHNTRLLYFAGAQELIENRATADVNDKKKLFADAMANLYKSIAIYPDYDLCHNQLAVVYLHVGKLDSAELHAQKAVKVGIIKDNLLNTLANVYMAEHRYKESDSLFFEAIKIDSSNLGYLFNVGLCKIHELQYDSAEYYSRKALIINPPNLKAMENMAEVFKLLGKEDSAAIYENKARQIEPNFAIPIVYLPDCGYFE